MIKEEQQKYINLLMSGDTEGAKKLASYKSNLIDAWSSDGSYFKLLPHYLVMRLIQENKDHWKESTRACIEASHAQGFGTVNGNSRENGMSILHAYILGYNLAKTKRKPEKILDDLREIYKIGWRPQKINEASVVKSQNQSGWMQSLMNELGFAFVSEMPALMINAILKVSPIDEPCHASGMTLMQYAAHQIMRDMLIRVASFGGDYKRQGEPGLCVPSAKQILKSPDSWVRHIDIRRGNDDSLLKISDQKMWDSSIQALEDRLSLEQDLYIDAQKKLKKEAVIKANEKARLEGKPTQFVPSGATLQAPPQPIEGLPEKKSNRRRVLNHD